MKLASLTIIGAMAILSADTRNSTAIICNQRESIADTSGDGFACGFTNSPPFSSLQDAGSERTPEDIAIEKRLNYLWHNVVGGTPNVIVWVKEGNENNPEYRYAAAFGHIDRQGRNVAGVYYKTKDLTPLLTTANGWLFCVIALHELGHHKNMHILRAVGRDSAELSADDYAGFILGKSLDASLDTALMAFQTLTDEHPTNGYPSRARRVAAAKAGWQRSQEPLDYSLAFTFLHVMGERAGVWFTDEQADFRDLSRAITHNSLGIVTTVDTLSPYFSAVYTGASFSPGSFYLDTNYLYVRQDGQYAAVGTVAKSNRPEYRRMIYDRFYNYLYIDSTGPNPTIYAYLRDSMDPKPDSIRQQVGKIFPNER
jgi:hypothetical protein